MMSPVAGMVAVVTGLDSTRLRAALDLGVACGPGPGHFHGAIAGPLYG